MKVLFITALFALTINSPKSPANNGTSARQPGPNIRPQTIQVVNNSDSAAKTDRPQNEPSQWYASPERQLVVVGFLTLLAIWYQARETAKATKAMERNTAAFIESQKPIIAADGSGNPLREIAASPVPRMKIDLHNKGTTTAYDCIQETWIELVPHKIEADGFTFNSDTFTFSEAAEHHISQSPFALYPNHDPVMINIPIPGGLSEAQRLAIRRAQLLVCIRIRVTFRDAFTPTRYADFGFWVMYEGLGYLAKYHDSN